MSSQGILKELCALLVPFQEEHLLQYISTWNPGDLCALKARLEGFPTGLWEEQKRVVGALPFLRTQKENLEPYNEYLEASSYEGGSTGEELIAAGQIAFVILAGGQGSRLGWKGPKALFPIFQGKTLLQMHLENIRRTHSSIPVAIMCSPLNSSKVNAAVGDLSNVEVFLQDLLPRMTRQERWFLEGEKVLSEGPDGNGKVFHYLGRAGILQRWQTQGIKHIVVVPIDNPLASSLDSKLIDCHETKAADVTSACIWREDPGEKVGVLARSGGKPCIVEYNEIHHEERLAKRDDGSLQFHLANTNIFIFRREFAASLTEKTLPLHAVSKPARFFSLATQAVEEIETWKFETFLFDVIPWARKMTALVYPRHQIYAPLKNAHGEKSPETVRAAIAQMKKNM